MLALKNEQRRKRHHRYGKISGSLAGQEERYRQRDGEEEYECAVLEPGRARRRPYIAPYQQGAERQQRIFEHRRKQLRRKQSGKRAAEHAAERHPDIELRELRGMRPAAIKL